jgi:hypothetical protein
MSFLVNIIRNDLRQVTSVTSVTAGFVTDISSKTDIYKLRYDVMARNKTVFPSNHYCIRNGEEFRDDYDDHPSTKHFLVRKNGKAVASCRLINGNIVPFEIEKFNWFSIPNKQTNNIVEPTRVVACKSIQGSYIAPFMLTSCLLDIYDSKYDNILGVVNADALHLIKHYQRFMSDLKQVSETKFSVNEFINGRSCHAFLLRVGNTDTEREKYIRSTLLPCFLMYKGVYFRDTFRGSM